MAKEEAKILKTGTFLFQAKSSWATVSLAFSFRLWQLLLNQLLNLSFRLYISERKLFYHSTLRLGP